MLNFLFDISRAQAFYLGVALICMTFQITLAIFMKFGKGDMAAILRMQNEEKMAKMYLRVGFMGYWAFLVVTSVIVFCIFLQLGWYDAVILGVIGGLILVPRQFLALKRVSKNQDALNRAKLFMDYDLKMPNVRFKVR